MLIFFSKSLILSKLIKEIELNIFFERKSDQNPTKINTKIVNENSESGKILDDKLTIACKEQSIKILEIQKEGKSRQPIDQFLIGNKIKQGEKII